jgi:antitoxin (DNA-binding transcriptional repressor) of toxin-antitoxin stability system
MLAKTIDVKDTATDWLALLALVRDGAEITLTEGGLPVARLVPIEPGKGERIPDLHPGVWEVSDDFDDPLPDEFWLGEDA